MKTDERVSVFFFFSQDNSIREESIFKRSSKRFVRFSRTRIRKRVHDYINLNARLVNDNDTTTLVTAVPYLPSTEFLPRVKERKYSVSGVVYVPALTYKMRIVRVYKVSFYPLPIVYDIYHRPIN